MKLKIALVTVAIAALSGCASIEKSMLCTGHTRAYFENRNAEMVKRQEEVEAMVDWEEVYLLGETRTMLSPNTFKYLAVKSYNEDLTQLQGQVANYNKVCVTP